MNQGRSRADAVSGEVSEDDQHEVEDDEVAEAVWGGDAKEPAAGSTDST